MEILARGHHEDGLRVDDITKTGMDFFAEVIERAAKSTQVKKGEDLENLKSVACRNCGKEAVQARAQLRSGDEGENVVVFCPSCGVSRVIG